MGEMEQVNLKEVGEGNEWRRRIGKNKFTENKAEIVMLVHSTERQFYKILSWLL